MTCSYIRGTEENREAVRIDVVRSGGVSSCIALVDFLTNGCRSFRCVDGSEAELTTQQCLDSLNLVKMERMKIKDQYAVKTYRGWKSSGISSFADFCSPGDKVDSEMVEYFTDVVPPVLMRTGCTQVGEPHRYERDGDGKHRPTFMTFHKVGGNTWYFDGYCFLGENENRVYEESMLEKQIRFYENKVVNGHG